MKVLTKPTGHSGTDESFGRSVEILQLKMMLGVAHTMDAGMTFVAPEIAAWAKLSDRSDNMMDVSGLPRREIGRRIKSKMTQAQTEFETYLIPRISNPSLARIYRLMFARIAQEHRRRGLY